MKHTFNKQLRLSDIYRYAVTGYETPIMGLNYECNKNATIIAVTFCVDGIQKYRFCDNEKERKEFLKEINKILKEQNKKCLIQIPR